MGAIYFIFSRMSVITNAANAFYFFAAGHKNAFFGGLGE